MTKGIKRRLKRVASRVEQDIVANTDTNSLYSRGLSREGYRGGYAQAISDVQLALNGVEPSDNRGYWSVEGWDESIQTGSQ